MVERVTFQKPAKVDDGYGGKKITWLSIFDMWAKVEPISSREYFFAQANQAEATHRIKVRYRPDIDQAMRISHRGKIYEITSVIDMGGSRRFLELLCVEGKENEETAQTFYDGGAFKTTPEIPLDLGSFTAVPGIAISLGSFT